MDVLCPPAPVPHPLAPARFPRRHPSTTVAGLVTVLLVATAHGYGYHRDELYFLACGHHLAWSYPDQGPVVPVLARLMSGLAPGSLTVLRLPSALMAGVVVALTGAMAGELGGGTRARAIAATVAGGSVIVLFEGHLLETSTVDLCGWTVVTWLLLRAVKRGERWCWPVAGVVAGIDLLNKPLIAALGGALLVGIAACGPRRLLRSPWVWAGVGIALALWSPWLIWQAAHGWPEEALSRSIARGGSTSSTPRWQLVPFQVLLVGPVLAPVWIAGLVRLVRRRELRFLGVAWVVLAVALTAAGGKSYYLAGLLPVLIAAGAPGTDRWLRSRRDYALVALASALIGSIIALPVLPAADAGPAVAANPDVAETVGWPALVATVADVRAGLGPDTRPVILTANYGEAGAVDRYGPARGLPRAYSGQNAFGLWGPPPGRQGPVIAVGLSAVARDRWLTGCRVVTHVADADRLGNQEAGAPIAVCAGPAGTWASVWPHLRYIG